MLPKEWGIGRLSLILLLLIIALSGMLSAVLINDIVCLAMTPPLVKICQRKKLDPIPYLLGLACGSNIGSALTLIGNPQNVLIGQVLNIPFVEYMINASIPCLLGGLVTWGAITLQTKGQWIKEDSKTPVEDSQDVKSPIFDQWQSTKGVIAVIVILGVFLFFNVPREHASLTVAWVLLISRRMASKLMLSFIDWQLLVLFIGLFIVNRELNRTDIIQHLLTFFETHQINLESPAWLFSISVILSNLISNVPSVMLLIPFAKSDLSGSILALSSTLAGNMFIVGSLANIIVITQAAKLGVNVNWRKHIVIGLPVSLITLGLSAVWLYLRYYL